MPSKLPEGVQIQVSRRSLPSDYEMPTMAMSLFRGLPGFGRPPDHHAAAEL